VICKSDFCVKFLLSDLERDGMDVCHHAPSRCLCRHISAISQLAIVVDVPDRGFHPEVALIIR